MRHLSFLFCGALKYRYAKMLFLQRFRIAIFLIAALLIIF